MANWYVRSDGLDTNPGNGPSTTQAFKTVGKALSATFAAAGDTVYVAPGVYRKQDTVGVSGTSGTPITVIGDVDGSHFASADVPVAPGEVRYTGFDGPHDWTAPSGANATLNINSKSNLVFQGIHWVGGKSNVISFGSAGSVNVTFQDCAITGGAVNGTSMVTFVGNVNTNSNIKFDRCLFTHWGTATCLDLTVPTTGGAEYSSGIVIQNCRFNTPNGINVIGVTATGGLANYGGGVLVQFCTFNSPGFALRTSGSATAIPSGVGKNTIQSCLLYGSNLNAAAAGQIVEDWNLIYNNSPRTLVTAGQNSISDFSYSPLFHAGQELLIGRSAQPFLTPYASGPAAGFGSAASPLTVDLLNRPRPSGGGSLNTGSDSGTATAATSTTLTDGSKTWTVNQWQATPAYFVTITGGTGSGQRRAIVSNTATALTVNPAWTTTPDATSTYTVGNNGALPAVGALERHDTLIKETVTVDAGSATAAVGPYDHEFYVPVTAASTTISVKVQWDANYGGGTLPQVTLLANAEIGVSAQTVTATGSSGAWNTVSLSAFTPTGSGLVKLRLVSNAAAAGKVVWDTASVPAVNTGAFDNFYRNQPALMLDSIGGGGGGRPAGLFVRGEGPPRL